MRNSPILWITGTGAFNLALLQRRTTWLPRSKYDEQQYLQSALALSQAWYQELQYQELQYQELQYQELQYYAALYQAVGGGWQQ